MPGPRPRFRLPGRLLSWRILCGDALERLRELPDRSVQTCITSPPYFGLRDYGTAEWEGGEEGCDHLMPAARSATLSTLRQGETGRPRDLADAYYPEEKMDDAGVRAPYGEICGKCGAVRKDAQVGLEPTPDEYARTLVAIFGEVRRVLRDDGTLWLNLGDSYAMRAQPRTNPASYRADRAECTPGRPNVLAGGIKNKDLLGIPWLVAFALRADGWYLRSEVIWAKPNPMPESVGDRPTRAHEQVFLLSKSPRYFYDLDAVRENFADERMGNPGAYERTTQESKGAGNPRSDMGLQQDGGAWDRGAELGGRNKRSVWTVVTEPYAEAHFATFPPKLILPMVLAGSSPQACGECGAPWERVTERETRYEGHSAVAGREHDEIREGGKGPHPTGGNARLKSGPVVASETKGWRPTCAHSDDSGQSVVLDPFSGAGTTGVVALRHERSYIGIELNPDYCEMSRERIRQDGPLFNVASER